MVQLTTSVFINSYIRRLTATLSQASSPPNTLMVTSTVIRPMEDDNPHDIFPPTPQDFSHRNLDGWHLEGCNLRRVNLSYSSFRGGSLRGSNLRGANFVGTDLTGTDLTGANLRDTGLIRIYTEVEITCYPDLRMTYGGTTYHLLEWPQHREACARRYGDRWMKVDSEIISILHMMRAAVS